MVTGKVGADVSVEKAQESAKLIAVNMFATLKCKRTVKHWPCTFIGDRFVRLTVCMYVCVSGQPSSET